MVDWNKNIDRLLVEENLRKHYVKEDYNDPLTSGSLRLMTAGQIVSFDKDFNKIIGSGKMYGSGQPSSDSDPRDIKKYVVTSV